MARPKATPEQYDEITIGTLAYTAWGRITAAEASRMLHMHRSTIARLCVAFFGRTPTAGRRAYVRLLAKRAMGTARRPLTKAELRRIAEDHDAQARQTATPDTKSDT